MDNVKKSESKSQGTPKQAETERFLGRAVKAAQSGDLPATLEALHKSQYLDGLVRWIGRQFPELTKDETYTVVGLAVDSLYASASKGRQISFPSSYLYKTCQRIALEAVERKRMHVEFEDHHGVDIFSKEEEAQCDEIRGELRSQALQMARSLLPRLGQLNIQRVIAYDLDAVEKEIEHVPTKEVSEALHLSEQTVRQCRSRGYRRLARLAKEIGIDLDATIRQIKEDEKEENDNG